MKSSYLKVSDIGEKGLIARIIAKTQECSSSEFQNYGKDFATLIGDDSALVNCSISENSYLVSSSDMLIQSTHFPEAMSYYQMGFKSVAVNISDIAAMGAEPIGFLLNLAIPSELAICDFDELICGIIKACNQYNIPLIGGDTNESSEIIISGTAIAKVEKDKAMHKYGLNKGDLICITGELGLAALGLELLFDNEKLKLANSIDSSFADLAIFKALNPVAKTKESFILRNFTKVATDITDGLASECYELLESDKKFESFKNLNSSEFRQSKQSEDVNPLNFESFKQSEGDNSLNYDKKIRLYQDKLPFETEFLEIAKSLNLSPFDLFFHVGEDFELLFTLNPNKLDELKKLINFFVIGEVIENLGDNHEKEDDSVNDFYSNTVEILLSNGELKKLSSKGYDHLDNN